MGSFLSRQNHDHQNIDEQAIEESIKRECEKLKKKLNAWKETDVKIGFIGRSGVGKSTQINKFRGFSDEDWENPLYAQTGSTQTTGNIVEYEYDDPDLKKIKLFDLPGSDTTSFPLQKYAEIVNMDQFHAFIFITSDRFYESDVAILNEIKKRKKPYFFTRTKMDEVARNLGKKHQKKLTQSWDEEWKKEQRKIVNECTDNLKDDSIPIFLISREEKEVINGNDGEIKIDFPDNQRLKESLIDHLPELQKKVFLVATAPDSKKLLELKVGELKDRIWTVAALSAVAGATPVPGLSFCADLGLFENERFVQSKTLGIDAESLQRKAEYFGLDTDNLIKRISDESSGNMSKRIMIQCLLNPTTQINFVDLEKAGNFLKEGARSGLLLGIAQLPEEAVKLVPVIGTIGGASMSALSTFALLRTMLWFHVLAAETFYDEIKKEYLNRQA